MPEIKDYETETEYKGQTIIVWNENGKRTFSIGNKTFNNMLFAKEFVDHSEQIKDAYQDDEGVWRWKSSNNVPFEDMLEAWGLDDDTMQKCIAAREKDNAEFAAEYRKRMENYVPSDEEMFEMRAAFGEGAKVVNVITGKEIQL